MTGCLRSVRDVAELVLPVDVASRRSRAMATAVEEKSAVS